MAEYTFLKSDLSDSSEASYIRAERSSRRIRRPYKSERIEPGFRYVRGPLSDKEIFARRLPWIATALGILMIIGGAYWGYSKVPKHRYSKIIWFEDFSREGYNLLDDFTRDVAFGAFGKSLHRLQSD